MTGHQSAAIGYALLCIALIAIGFGPLEDWQAAVRNWSLVIGAVVIVLAPRKKVTK